MPYIIETHTPTGQRVQEGTVCAVTARTAVATLDEARSSAHATVHAVYRAAYPLKPRGLGGEHSDAQHAHRWHNVDVDKLPESGGTVGPLPDGTVIEVRPMLREDVTASASEDRYIAGMTADEMVAAFNAA